MVVLASEPVGARSRATELPCCELVLYSFQLFKVMNHLGLSQSQDTSRDNVDRLAEECDEELVKWKTDFEVSFIIGMISSICLIDLHKYHFAVPGRYVHTSNC